MKKLPQNIEIEKAVLSACINTRDAFATVYTYLDENSFYTSTNKKIFNTLLNLYQQRSAIDLLTVSNAIGIELAMEISSVSFSIDALESHCLILNEHKISRALISMGQEITRSAFDDDAFEVLSSASMLLDSISGDVAKQKNRSINDIVLSMIKEMEKAQDVGKVGMPLFDIDDLDDMGGAENGDLIIIAGRPAMGKSQMGVTIASNLGLKQDKSIYISSLEMRDTKLTTRLISNFKSLDYGNLQRGDYLKNEEFIEACAILTEKKIIVDEKPGLTVNELKARLLTAKRNNNIDLAIIDHGGLIKLEKGNESTSNKIGNISNTLKNLAKELQIPIVLLWQLSRSSGIEKRMPQLTDLRNSGDLEQDADKVYFIHRPEYYDEFEQPGVAHISCAKNRNGITGIREIKFEGKYCRFSSSVESSPFDVESPDMKINRKINENDIPF